MNIFIAILLTVIVAGNWTFNNYKPNTLCGDRVLEIECLRSLTNVGDDIADSYGLLDHMNHTIKIEFITSVYNKIITKCFNAATCLDE